MQVIQKDRSILRRLADQQAAIAALPIHTEKILEWKRLNSNISGRPLVWIDEIPWHEMDVDGELELQTTDPFCQEVEKTLRQTLYQWKHMPVDMVIEAKFYSPLVIHDSGFGISELSDMVITDQSSDIVSRDFHSQIDSEKDLEKIKFPVVTHDEEASERNFQFLLEVFGDILTIEKIGIVHSWFSPWDELIQWWGVEKAMMDLVLRPNLVHQAMDCLVNGYLSRLRQWKELNLLSVTDGNYRVGSGGLGYTNELPQPGFNSRQVRTSDQWGSGAAQIFSGVSPEMHDEFALQYEKRWMEHFGLNYYGCCDALHNKIDILKTIPNLRKVSMSPWANVEKMVENSNRKYVLSYKPNPAIFALDRLDPNESRKNLHGTLEKAKGCVVEIIMKDISTVRYQPQRLWEWSRRTMEMVLS
ncbi:hypothetical protein D4S03_06890 [bacterium]|nr:MAG: hypothetical protein D4S03_06890 [bacterium]